MDIWLSMLKCFKRHGADGAICTMLAATVVVNFNTFNTVWCISTRVAKLSPWMASTFKLWKKLSAQTCRSSYLCRSCCRPFGVSSWDSGMRQNNTGCRDLNATWLPWAFCAARALFARPHIQVRRSRVPPQSPTSNQRWKQVDNHSQIPPSFACPEIGYIADPLLVWSLGAEILRKQVWRDWKMVLRVCWALRRIKWICLVRRICG